ncbi:MAG: tetratricopeptide repeat protein, partial [Verrucomicrobiales bacterium]|nr:tetratricopeptide repeat protein [Verrucomicrobiales bacterium]
AADTVIDTLGLTPAAPTPSLDTCLNRLGHTAAHRIDTLSAMRARLTQPPFSTQTNHAGRDAALANQIGTLRKSLSAAKLKTARASLGAQITAHPRDWFLHQRLALLLNSAGQHQAAAQAWGEAARLMPHYTIYLQHGKSLNRARDWPAAEAALRKAITARPDLAAAHDSLGIALSQQSRFEDSYAAFATASKLAPSNINALIHWAQVLENQKNTGAAIDRVRQAVTAAPDQARAHYHLGRLLSSQSEFQAALPHYQRAAELEPNNPASHINYAFLLIKLQQPDAAIPALQRALELDPSNTLVKQQLQALLP